jgi:uncharacterized membrane protein
MSLVDLEERLSGRLLAWAGGIALVVGGLFFLSLAFNRGWIGPEARVLIGLVGAATAIGIGAWLFDRGSGTPALVLVAVGVAVGMLALFAATSLYRFIPPQLGLVGSFVIAGGAAGIAIRANSQAVAAIGLIAALAAPPILGAPANVLTLLFVGSGFAATTAIALWRSWSWLPPLAFLITAPQVASWLGGEERLPLALFGLAVYWGLNVLACGGETLGRSSRPVQRPAVVTFVASGLFTVFAIRDVLADTDAGPRIAVLLALALAYAAVAGPLLATTRARHPFGVLASGGAVTTLILLIGLEFGGAFQPIAWTALAVALAWSAIRFDHGPAGIGALVAGSLALLHLVYVEYPMNRARQSSPPDGLPFVGPEGIVLGIIVGAVLIVTALVARDPNLLARMDRRATPRLAVAVGVTACAALVAYAAPFELAASHTVVLWSALAVALMLTARPAWEASAEKVTFTVAVILVGLGIRLSLSTVAPLGRLSVDRFASPTDMLPLVNDATLALESLAGALVIGALSTRLARARTWTAGGAAVLITYLLSIAIVDVFQAQVGGGADSADLAFQAQVALSIAWVLGGAVAFAVGVARALTAARMFGLGLLTLATAKVFLFDLSALDVAYRVLSFIGLGLVLLATSFLAIRARPSVPATGEDLPG